MVAQLTPAHESPPAALGDGSWREVLVVLAMGVGFAIVWSSAFSFAKILVGQTPPFAVSALRFLVAGTVAGIVALALGQRLPRGAAAWRSIVVLGLCQNTLALGLFFNAMTRIPAGLAAIVASSMPLVVAGLAPLLIAEKVRGRQFAGLAVGFAGVLWITSRRVGGTADALALALTVLGVLAFAIATLTVKSGNFGSGLLMVVACQMLVGALGCVPLALIFEDISAFSIDAKGIVAFAYLVLFPGILATLLWFALVRRLSAARASSFHFLNPIFGVAFAWLLLGERVSASDAVGVALVALGILIVNTGRST